MTTQVSSTEIGRLKQTHKVLSADDQRLKDRQEKIKEVTDKLFLVLELFHYEFQQAFKLSNMLSNSDSVCTKQKEGVTMSAAITTMDKRRTIIYKFSNEQCVFTFSTEELKDEFSLVEFKKVQVLNRFNDEQLKCLDSILTTLLYHVPKAKY